MPPIQYSPPSPESVSVEDALDDWLRVEGRTRLQASDEIRRITEQYRNDSVAQKNSLSIGGALDAAEKLAKQTEDLANLYRHSNSVLETGTATAELGEHAATTPAAEAFKRQVADRAFQLDEWANEFRARAESWSEQPRQIKVHENINLGPQRRLLNDSALLFFKHRPKDFHASPDGSLYAFVRIIYELAEGKKPKKAALLSPLRDIVKAIKEKQH